MILAIDVQEPIETVQKFIAENGYTFKVLPDMDAAVSLNYNVRQHPMKFIIDKDGAIVGSARGYRKWDSDIMRALIDNLIAQETVSETRRQ